MILEPAVPAVGLDRVQTDLGLESSGLEEGLQWVSWDEGGLLALIGILYWLCDQHLPHFPMLCQQMVVRGCVCVFVFSTPKAVR